MTRLLMALIRAYQLLLSPLLGPTCRYEPSCSRYAMCCLRDHGPLKGSWFALKRILRCHPFAGFGYDPPPPPRTAEPVARISSTLGCANEESEHWRTDNPKGSGSQPCLSRAATPQGFSRRALGRDQ